MKRCTCWIVIGLIFALIAMSVSITQAQYISEREQREQYKADERAKLLAALQAVIGKTFWYLPNPKPAFGKIAFLEPLSDEKFFVTTDTSFIVVDYESGQYDKYYLKLKFPDGKVGYLPVNRMFLTNPDYYPVIENLYHDDERYDDFKEYIFSQPPQVIFAAQKAKQAKATAELKAKQAKAGARSKARGGVRIGMTAAQVIKSNWGKPNNINRTTTPYSECEQWVYGDHNYLYFENGILTSIQN